MFIVNYLNKLLFRQPEDDDDDDDQEELQLITPKKYEDKYPLNHLRNNNDDACIINPNSYVLEYTPVGNVMLNYNLKKESFEYFSDRVVSYRILETVARKFVNMNQCPQIYDTNQQNRFSYSGKLMNFSILSKPELPKLRFSDYKKISSSHSASSSFSSSTSSLYE